MPPAAVATPTAADVYNKKMKKILRDIVLKVWRKPARSTDVWLRLVNLVQKCPPSTLQVQSRNGYTVLFHAARCRQPLICRLLLARGANFKEALEKGDWDEDLFNLLRFWDTDRRRWDDEGARSRARTTEAEVVRVLISGGEDVDVQDEYGDTLLKFVCQTGHVELVETFLSAPGERLGWEKSAVVVIDGDRSLFQIALLFGCLEVIKVFCRQEFRPKVLAVSANDGGLDLGRYAREGGFDELAEFIEGFAWDKIA